MRPVLFLIIGSFILPIGLSALGADAHSDEAKARQSSNDSQVADVRAVLAQIGTYRDKLLFCNSDKGAKSLAELLEGLPEVKASSNQSPESLAGLLQSLKTKSAESEDVLRAHIALIRKVLAAKAQKFQADRQSFEADDSNLVNALSSLELSLSISGTFDEEKAKKDPKTSPLIAKADAAVRDYSSVRCTASPPTPLQVSNPGPNTASQSVEDPKGKKDGKKEENNGKTPDSKPTEGKPQAEPVNQGGSAPQGSRRLGGGLGGLFPGLGKPEREKEERGSGGSPRQSSGGQSNLNSDSGNSDKEKSSSPTSPKTPEKKESSLQSGGGTPPSSSDQNSKREGEKKSGTDGGEKKTDLFKESKREPTPSPSAAREESKAALEAMKEQQLLQLKAMTEQQGQGADGTSIQGQNSFNASKSNNGSGRGIVSRTAPPRPKGSGVKPLPKIKR